MIFKAIKLSNEQVLFLKRESIGQDSLIRFSMFQTPLAREELLDTLKSEKNIVWIEGNGSIPSAYVQIKAYSFEDEENNGHECISIDMKDYNASWRAWRLIPSDDETDAAEWDGAKKYG